MAGFGFFTDTILWVRKWNGFWKESRKHLFPMKTILLFVAGLLSLIPAYSQVIVLGKNLSANNDVAYIKVSIRQEREDGLNVIRATVDFGQENFFLSQDESMIQTPEGKLKDFKSDMDVFNFLHRNGWEYVNSWQHYFGAEPNSHGSGEAYQYHLFRKKLR